MDQDIFKTPSVTPKIKVWKYQWIGMLLLILIPILALFGVFGESMKQLQAKEGGLRASVSYPDRMRLGQTEYIRIKISNDSNENLKKVTASFSHNYLKQFDEIEAIPTLNESFKIVSGEIPKKSSRYIYFKLKAKEFGNHTGVLNFENENASILSMVIKTLVLP